MGPAEDAVGGMATCCPIRVRISVTYFGMDVTIFVIRDPLHIPTDSKIDWVLYFYHMFSVV